MNILDGSLTMILTENLAKAANDLTKTFGGKLFQPTDAGYDDARRVHNGLVDKHPAIIARCARPADIVDAVSFGRNQGLEIAVRGGGHNVAGLATVEDGLMMDWRRPADWFPRPASPA